MHGVRQVRIKAHKVFLSDNVGSELDSFGNYIATESDIDTNEYQSL